MKIFIRKKVIAITVATILLAGLVFAKYNTDYSYNPNKKTEIVHVFKNIDSGEITLAYEDGHIISSILEKNKKFKEPADQSFIKFIDYALVTDKGLIDIQVTHKDNILTVIIKNLNPDGKVGISAEDLKNITLVPVDWAGRIELKQSSNDQNFCLLIQNNQNEQHICRLHKNKKAVS